MSFKITCKIDDIPTMKIHNSDSPNNELPYRVSSTNFLLKIAFIVRVLGNQLINLFRKKGEKKDTWAAANLLYVKIEQANGKFVRKTCLVSREALKSFSRQLTQTSCKYRNYKLYHQIVVPRREHFFTF